MMNYDGESNVTALLFILWKTISNAEVNRKISKWNTESCAK